MTSLVSHVKRQGVAYLALFAALGGTSYAAITVTGTNVKNGTLTGQDVRDGSIGARDLQKGIVQAGGAGERGPQGEKGEQGAQGIQGEKGERGATGTVDTSGFYTKAASDDRYLAKSGQAADADKLDGTDANGFARTQSVHKVLNYGNAMDHDTVALFWVPERGSLGMGCYINGGGGPHVEFSLSTYNGARTTFQQHRANVAEVFEPGSISFAQSSGGRVVDTFTIRYASQSEASSGMTTVEVVVAHNRNGGGACDITAQAITQA